MKSLTVNRQTKINPTDKKVLLIVYQILLQGKCSMLFYRYILYMYYVLWPYLNVFSLLTKLNDWQIIYSFYNNNSSTNSQQ